MPFKLRVNLVKIRFFGRFGGYGLYLFPFAVSKVTKESWFPKSSLQVFWYKIAHVNYLSGLYPEVLPPSFAQFLKHLHFGRAVMLGTSRYFLQ